MSTFQWTPLLLAVARVVDLVSPPVVVFHLDHLAVECQFQPRLPAHREYSPTRATPTGSSAAPRSTSAPPPGSSPPQRPSTLDFGHFPRHPIPFFCSSKHEKTQTRINGFISKVKVRECQKVFFY